MTMKQLNVDLRMKKTAIIFFCLALIFSAFSSFTFSTKQASAANVILIKTVDDLNDIRDNMNGNYKLANDIDLSEWGNWEPIGGTDTFEGTFDGDGHTIKNFTSNEGGLFGRTRGATFKDFKMTDVDINASRKTVGAVSDRDFSSLFENIEIDGIIHAAGVGGLVYDTQDSNFNNVHVDLEIRTGAQHAGGIVARGGNIRDSSAKGNIYAGGFSAGGLASQIATIRDSHSEMNIESTGDSSNFTGGLVGTLTGDLIENSYATGNVKSTRDHVGGLIGRTHTHGSRTIKNSYATGNVEGRNHVGGLVGYTYEVTNNFIDSYSKDNTVKGNQYVGGFAGTLQGEKTHVMKSFTTSTVLATGDAENVGGFVGELSKYATIEDSFARGPVGGLKNVGGFVGNNRGSTIERSYATGAVNGEDNVGGFVGRDSHGQYGIGANNALVAPDFFDKQTTGMDDEKGPIAETTANMQIRDTFKHWNFTSTWKLEGKEYPVLRDKPFDLVTDVPDNYWGRDDVTEIIEKGIMQGSEDPNDPDKNIFRPADDITRAEFAIVIINALGLSDSATNSETTFNDDDAIPSWAEKEVAKAQEEGIVEGDDSGNFNPMNKIGRAEIATMIARAYELEAEDSGDSGIMDSDEIPDWAKAAADAVIDAGVMQGQDRDGKLYFAPGSNAQRIEAGLTALRAYNLD